MRKETSFQQEVNTIQPAPSYSCKSSVLSSSSLFLSFLLYLLCAIFIISRNPGAQILTIEDELEKAIHLAGGIRKDNLGDLSKVLISDHLCGYWRCLLVVWRFTMIDFID